MGLMRSLIGFVACLAILGAGFSVNAKEKEKEAAGKTIDSGTFSVLKNGRHVATETFSVQEGSGGSTVVPN